jgi:protein KRI1
LREAQIRQVEELKRLKTLKRQEIEEQTRIIEEISGLVKNGAGKALGNLSNDQLKELLEGEFDSRKFDAQMSALFDANYDAAVDDQEVEEMENELDLGVFDDGESIDLEDNAFAETYEEELQKAKGKKVAAHHDRFLHDDDFAMLYPAQAIRKMEEDPSMSSPKQISDLTSNNLPALQAKLESKVDEYWKLHFHSVAGGVRTRFKYKSVNPETFGLTDFDVLGKDDRQLNMIAPLNCYAAYLGPDDNLRDRFKALSRVKNVRVLDPARSSRRYGKELSKTQVFDASFSEEEALKVSKRLREGPLAEHPDRSDKRRRK